MHFFFLIKKNENSEQLLDIFKGLQEKLNEDPLPKEQVPLPVRYIIIIVHILFKI